MNPTTAAKHMGPRRLVDIAGPAHAHAHRPAVAHTGQPPSSHMTAPSAAPSSPSVPSTTNIVENIPMHAPVQPAHPVLKEDAELDTIMQDIGHELKQAVRKTPKKRFSLLKHRHRVPAPKPTPLAHPHTAVPAQVSSPIHPPPAVKPAARHAARPVKTTSAPVGVIFMTLIVTGALIAAALYSYK